MRTCPNCNAEFADNEVFCPVCGQEVQLVPDFMTIENHYQQAQLQSEEEERQREEARDRELIHQKRVKQRRNHVILAFCLAAAALIGAFAVTHAMTVNRQNESFDYQYEQALAAYESGDYIAAESFLRSARALDPDNREVQHLLARLYLAQNKETEAESALLGLLEKYPDSSEAYEMLIGMYVGQGRMGDVQALVASCPIEEIRNKYAAYLPSGPSVFPEEGIYNKDQEITLTSEQGGTIYYTTDGSEPGEGSAVYSEPFTIREGITTVKALLVTHDGFRSPVSAAIYQIQYDAPPAPVITPESGTYTVTRRVDASGSERGNTAREEPPKITVSYPEGFICHYSFDKKPTADSPVYRQPLEMQRGEHIFYAVLESDTGKLGTISSATYIYEVRLITPTPTPTPTQRPETNYTPVRPAETEPAEEPTPTDTPTPEPSATPDPATPAPSTAPTPSAVPTPTSDPTPSVDPTPVVPDPPSPPVDPGDGGGDTGGGDTGGGDTGGGDTGGGDSTDYPSVDED